MVLVSKIKIFFFFFGISDVPKVFQVNILLPLQSTLSVQFDDLFKKAWEEDVTELPIDGMTTLDI